LTLNGLTIADARYLCGKGTSALTDLKL